MKRFDNKWRHRHTRTHTYKCRAVYVSQNPGWRINGVIQDIHNKKATNKCNRQLVTNVSQCVLFTSSWLRGQVHGSINTFSPETGQSLITSFRCRCADFFALADCQPLHMMYIHPTSNTKTQRKREKNNIKRLHIGFCSTLDDFKKMACTVQFQVMYQFFDPSHFYFGRTNRYSAKNDQQ